MECRFQVGSKVTCVHPLIVPGRERSQRGVWLPGEGIVAGGVYTVTAIWPHFEDGEIVCALAEVSRPSFLGYRMGYHHERFRPIHETQIEELRRTVRKVFDKTDKREVVPMGVVR